MVETEKQRKARSYIAGAASLLDELQHPYMGIRESRQLEAPMALLELARATVAGKDEAREAKNAGDRARRAKAKPKAKTPAPQKGKRWSAALKDPALDS